MVRLLPLFLLLLLSGSPGAWAQLQTAGTMVVVPAYGEVKHSNDEARVLFTVEEQDKDRSAAASRVNQKMRQGMEVIRREDPQAILQTRGYYTYPVYAEEPPQPRQSGKTRQLLGWRVGQQLEVKTQNLQELPRTVAAAQKVLALSDLQFGLSEATEKKLEEERIAAAYQNLMDRIAAIAKTMNRRMSDGMLDTVDFEASGAYAPQQEAYAAKSMRVSPGMDRQVVEPSFEPGETTLSMRVVGRVRFK